MARRQEFNGQGKTISNLVAQTLTWTSTEISSRKIVKYVFATTGGAANQIGNITRLKVLANGFPIVNMSGTQLRAYIERFSRSNFALGAAATRWSLPFYLLDAPTWDMGDVAQFPNNAQVQVELTTNASVVTGTCLLGWEETDIDAELMTKLLSSVMNIPPSSPLSRFNFGENGVVRGVSCNTVGVDQIRIVIAGENAFHASGALFLNATAGDMSAEFEALAGGAVSVTDPIFHEITLGKAAPSQTSYVELVTQAGFLATNETCIYAVAPNLIQVAA